MITALALWGCDGGETVTPPEDVFPERDFVCADGESPPCATTTPAHTDAERAAEEGAELDNETRIFVVKLLSIPEADGNRAVGFNLDGIDSGDGDGSAVDCREVVGDFISTTDPDHIGVDNGLESLVGLLSDFLDDPPCDAAPNALDCTLEQQILSGSVLLLLQVSGVDSLDYDRDVKIQLMRAEVPGGGMPAAGSNGLEPGQTFSVIENLGPEVDGDIFAGRVRATAASITINIETDDFDIPLVITSPQLRFDISDDGLANGVIGGSLKIEDLATAAEMIMAGLGATVRAAVEGDVSPASDDPSVCEAMSVGIAFEATTAMTN